MKRSLVEDEAAPPLCWSYADALHRQREANIKITCYSTIIYTPPNPMVNFGIPTWPPTLLKKDVSPRVLLVSTWTDNRWGFIGGGAKKNESPLQAVNREFSEETGTAFNFEESDFVFCDIGEKNAVFMFCNVTTDLSFFNSLLAGFYTTERRAYPDEVLAICGYPVWVEGPASVSEVCWEKQVHGLPRHLVSCGGFMTPTMGRQYDIIIARSINPSIVFFP
jgi:8-oxo-dGTP pyrophosphatase MutT (NUDIX family)